MPPEIVALIDAPLSLIAVLFVGALMGMAVEQFVSKQKRAKWRRKNAGRWKKKGSVKGPMASIASTIGWRRSARRCCEAEITTAR